MCKGKQTKKKNPRKQISKQRKTKPQKRKQELYKSILQNQT